jgi:hypothetical protein
MRVCPFASPRSDKQFRELAHGEIVVNYQNNWQGLCHRWKSGCVGTRYRHDLDIEQQADVAPATVEGLKCPF